MFATTAFTRLVEKATSHLNLEPDWDSTLQICDSIRQGDVQAKFAIQSLKKKIAQDNPHVSVFALGVLESCVKNCGTVIHEEIATKEFMEFLKDQAKIRPDPVKAKILELVQVWSHAFRNEPSYKVVQDTFHLMKMEGYTFPTLKEADAMFKAESAPEWKDGDCCHRCRVTFSTFQRKHHCRHCGNVFCNKCSSKTSIIPKFGLEKEVRVCESCYEEINGPSNAKKDDEGLPPEYLSSPLSKQPQNPPSKTEQELQEEEELQLAIALSMSEVASKEKERNQMKSKHNNKTSSSANNATYSQPVKVTGVIDTTDMDPELARYLNRNYWQQKHEEIKTSTTQPSAPVAVTETKASTGGPRDKANENYQNGETSDDEEEFLNALRTSTEIFVNRMRSNSARGRSIATDSSVQTLFMTITAMHPQLMKYLSDLEDARSHYETLQDKLAQLKDARDALDALRDEHREKRRREQEELERQRQIQMAQKLEILRQKKQEYLEYQRQVALQRMQEQEREMQMRFEQQKQLQQIRAMQYGYPQIYAQQPQTFSPVGSTEGSPHHQLHAGAPPVGASGTYNMPAGMPVAPGAPGSQLPSGEQIQPGHMMPGMGPAAGQMVPGQMAPGSGQMPPGTGHMAPSQGPAGAQLPPNTMPPGTVADQPGYGQSGYQPNTQPQPVPADYQHVPPGGYPATTYGSGMIVQNPAVTTQQQGTILPPSTQQPPQSEYQTFNMQAMANTLPNHSQSGQPVAGGVTSQQIPGGQNMYPGPAPVQGQYLPASGQSVQQHPGQPQIQQGQPPQQEQNDTQLISFD